MVNDNKITGAHAKIRKTIRYSKYETGDTVQNANSLVPFSQTKTSQLVT